MKARQRYRYRARQSDVIVDMVIWALPVPTPERQHGIKYRLHCGREGHCIVRYDNETGKGDHRHEGEQETPYPFYFAGSADRGLPRRLYPPGGLEME